MYVPAHFRADDERAFARELIAAHPFALLITVEADEPVVTHVPCVLFESGEAWRIAGHIARANPQSAHIGRRATIVFTGAHGYVSPSWYEASPRNVPTWNYSAVVCRGPLEALSDDETDALLRTLTERNESRFSLPWSPDAIGAEEYRQFRRAIVPFQLNVDSLNVKVKYSQNRTSAERDTVVAALAALGGDDTALAEAMRKIDASSPEH
jgi:transcriptional regulator